MARFFKFRSITDLQAAASELGLRLPLQPDLSPLFQPFKVGPYCISNRFCIHPMEGCDGTLEGKPDELTFRRYRRFGAGGAKLIWGEAVAVVPEGRANPRQLLANEDHAGGLERIVRECRQAHRDAFGRDDDLVVGLQLTHSGRYSHQWPLMACHDPLLDSRAGVDKHHPLLTDDELERLEDRYVAAARLAIKVGFQFVDVKQCHRYLLNELLASRTRPGRYGGCFENRTRFASNVIHRIRDEVPGAMVAARINLFDGIPYRKGKDGIGEPEPWQSPVLTAWGTNPTNPLEPDLTEPLKWIGEMQKLGVALVNVSLGNPYASPHLGRPFEYPPPDGYETPEPPLVGVARHFDLAAAVQRAYPDLPIVGTGYSYLQEFFPQAGAANVASGRITFVGIGRGALAQPDFARQLMEHGCLDRKRTCRTFSYCTALMRSKHNGLGQFPSGCPPFDKEGYQAEWEEARRR